MPPRTDFSRRNGLVRSDVKELGLDGLVVSHPANVRYLSGFSGSAGLLVLWGGDDARLITDFRYREQAEAEVGQRLRVEIIQRDPWAAVQGVLANAGVGQAGFESAHVPESLAAVLRGRRKVRFRGVTGVVEARRAVKDPEEIGHIRGAAEIAEAALQAVIPCIRPGTRELDVAAELERALRVRGSEWHPFETIVASGPRSALPHARTTDREIQPGEFVLIDFGAIHRGYCSDLTRTFVTGRANERQRSVYELVREAQKRAIDGLRGGLSGVEADMLARGFIDTRGFGDAFGHSLGHGLGLEVHEEPRLSSANETALPVDAVVTVEPGVYIPGWGGVRIEDDVHLTARGVERLTRGSTELCELS